MNSRNSDFRRTQRALKASEATHRHQAREAAGSNRTIRSNRSSRGTITAADIAPIGPETKLTSPGEVHRRRASHASGSGGNGGKGRSNAQVLLSRRGFLYGAIGVGAAAVIGGVAYSTSQQEDDSVEVLTVPSSAVSTQNDFASLDDYESSATEMGSYDLTYGTLVWANSDSVAACLLPTDTGSPLAQIGLLALGTGTLTTALEQAVSTSEGFEIYDVRATESGAIWTEANVLENRWRIYAARTSSNSITQPLLVDEGDGTYETPTLAAVGDYAFWQVLPKSSTSDLQSRLKRVRFGSQDAEDIYVNKRRMATAPYSAEDAVVITPRIDSSTVYYQLVKIDAQTGEVEQTVTLPHSMTPLEAGWGDNGFMFSFENIYSYGDGISNLGTYTPMTNPNGDYNNASWFNFVRTPSAAPCWCDGIFIVKSSYSVCGVDMDNRNYFAIEVDNGADDYGEYLATTGSHSLFVTYTNIDYAPVDSEAVKACRVKVWQVDSSSSGNTTSSTSISA